MLTRNINLNGSQWPNHNYVGNSQLNNYEILLIDYANVISIQNVNLKGKANVPKKHSFQWQVLDMTHPP